MDSEEDQARWDEDDVILFFWGNSQAIALSQKTGGRPYGDGAFKLNLIAWPVSHISFLFPIRIVTTRKLTALTGMVQWHVGVYVI